ncbi:ABC transporter permease [Hyalangium versicolor]|uniref:ABC transporter permease n=1 Tax=Hyalangium versicolor TaxID=2861190 RepID=UPI001CCFB743|nr:FtsX-like permease family protein [Hyalangium versicolor]
MNVIALASRNVLRNARRSALTAVALVVGTLAILVFGGYVNDNIHGLQTITVRQVGHLQVVRKDYLDFGRGDPGRFSIRDYEALMRRIQTDEVLAPMLAVVTPVLQVEGAAGNFAAGASSNFSGIGVEPSGHAKMLAWDGFGAGIPPGKTALRADAPDGGIVGFQMAQLLALCGPLKLTGCKELPTRTVADPKAATLPEDISALGQAEQSQQAGTGKAASIELLAASPSGLPNVVRMNVLEAERQVVRDIDALYVAMPLPLAQRLVFGPDERAVSAVVIQLRHSDMLPAAQARLNQLVKESGQLEVLTFHEVSPVYDQIVSSYTSVFTFIAALMGLIALFSIANAVNMAVGERIGEIGTLRSLGFQRTSIRSIFILEGALLGVFGTIVGAVLALLFQYGLDLSGFAWTPPGRSTSIPLRIDVLGSPSMIAATVLGLSAVACLSALWPANRAARMEVTEALQHV